MFGSSLKCQYYKIIKNKGGNKMKKLDLGNVQNLEIALENNTITITGIIPGGSVDTEFETRVSHDGEIVTRHSGVGPGFIWTDWEDGYLRGE
jgi:hypothetical protein